MGCLCRLLQETDAQLFVYSTYSGFIKRTAIQEVWCIRYFEAMHSREFYHILRLLNFTFLYHKSCNLIWGWVTLYYAMQRTVQKKALWLQFLHLENPSWKHTREILQSMVQWPQCITDRMNLINSPNFSSINDR